MRPVKPFVTGMLVHRDGCCYCTYMHKNRLQSLPDGVFKI